jgi:TonB family protein
MAENPRLGSDLVRSAAFSKSEAIDSSNSSMRASQAVTDVAQKLAAHGVGAASLDLALDLVLHDVAEQARETTGATGAAIALIKDDQMVCRATAGENAPDLGVRVETGSGLAGICVNTGKIQHCPDTELDPRANLEACRRLGVRSMVILPLFEGDKVFGLVEVFSRSPGIFGDPEIGRLRAVGDRVAESLAAVGNTKPAPNSDDVFDTVPQYRKREEKPGVDLSSAGYSFFGTPSRYKANESLTAVLFLLVIAAAVTLGIVVGWSGGMNAKSRESLPESSRRLAIAEPNQNLPGKVDSESGSSGHEISLKSTTEVKVPAVPEGGLVVTQNGRVIFRSRADSNGQSAMQSVSSQRARRLVHRVEPDYPAEARSQHIEGTVVLDIEIEQDGNIGTVAVVSGDPVLAQAAVHAVKQWQYQPDPNQLAASQTRIAVKFTLPPAS